MEIKAIINAEVTMNNIVLIGRLSNGYRTYRDRIKQLYWRNLKHCYQSMIEYIGKNKNTKVVAKIENKLINIFRICDCMLESQGNETLK